MAKQIFEKIIELRFSEVKANAQYDLSEKEATIEIPNLIGMTLVEAGSMLASIGLQYLVSGEGNRVTEQIAGPGTMVKQGDIVLLVME